MIWSEGTGCVAGRDAGAARSTAGATESIAAKANDFMALLAMKIATGSTKGTKYRSHKPSKIADFRSQISNLKSQISNLKSQLLYLRFEI